MSNRKVIQSHAVPSAEEVGSIYSPFLSALVANCNQPSAKQPSPQWVMPLDPAGHKLPLPPMHFTIDKNERKIVAAFH